MQYLKCDELGCEHVEHHQNLTADMVGKECPTCGSNLLTQSDWEQFSALQKMVSLLGGDFVADSEGDYEVGMHVHDGVITTTVKPRK